MLASSTRPPIKNARYSCCKLISFPFRHRPAEGAGFGVLPVNQDDAAECSV
jgi:hypothetical protein